MWNRESLLGSSATSTSVAGATAAAEALPDVKTTGVHADPVVSVRKVDQTLNTIIFLSKHVHVSFPKKATGPALRLCLAQGACE